MTVLLPALVLLPLAAAPLPALLVRVAGLDPALPALAASLGALALALAVLTGVLAGEPAVSVWPWAPALGLSFALRADRVAAGFAVAIAAGGALAILSVRRAGRGQASARRVGGVLALAGATLGVVLADDLALLWCCLEFAALASVGLLGADRGRRRGRGAALATLVALEAGGLALLAAALLIADVAGGFRLGDALRAGAELRANALYLPMAGLVLAAATTRLAPWLLPAAGDGARLARAAGLVGAAVLVLRLGPALGGTGARPAVLAAFGTAILVLAAWRAWRGGAESRTAPAAGPSLIDQLALAARLVWQPLAAPHLWLSLMALGAASVMAAALGASGARPAAWPAPTSSAWPLVAGSAWLLLAVVAGIARVRHRRTAATLACAAAGALLLLAAAAPPAVALAEIVAGVPALWLFARARAVPLPSRRALAGLGALAATAVASHWLIGGPPVGPTTAAVTAATQRAGLALLAPLALPLAAAVALAALGRAPDRLRRALAGMALAANLALAATLLWVADRGEPVALALGAGTLPVGIHLLLDRLAGELLLVAALLAALAFGHALVNPAAGRRRHAEALGQLQLFGIAGCLLAADLLELLVFFEVLLLVLQAELTTSVATDGAAAAHVAVVGTAGTALMLIAIGCVDAALGTTGYAALALRAPAVAVRDSPLLGVGAYLLLIVLALRAAALPLGLWLSRALEAAPAAAAVCVVALTQVGVYALVRLYVLVFPCFGAGPCGPSGLVLPLGLATVAAGGIGALAATGLRAIAPPLLLVAVGTLLVGVGSFRVAGLTAAIYALAPAALAAAALAFAGDGDGGGRGRRALVVATLLGALGLPPFPGWIARVAILGASGADAFVVWTLVLSTMLLAGIAAARVAAAADGARPGPMAASSRRGSAATGAALALLGALTLTTGPAFDLATRTARQLLDRRAYVAAFLGGDTGAPAR